MKANPPLNPMTEVVELWQGAVRYKWWIFLSTVLLTLGAVVGIVLIPDQYRATTTILVDPQKIPDEYVRSTVRANLTSRLQTISQEVLSATQLQKIIDQWKLYPELRDSHSREELIEYMRIQVKIDVKHASGQGPGSFAITYQGKDAAVVAQVANQLATKFIDWNLESREQLAMGTTEFLSDQLNQSKAILEEQEATLRAFKMRHLGEMPDHLEANLRAISQLQTTLQANAARMHRLQLERFAVLNAPDAMVSSKGNGRGMSERTRLVAERLDLEGEVFDLKRRYTPAHPDVLKAEARLVRVHGQLQALPPLDPESEPLEDRGKGVRLQIIDREMENLNQDQEKIMAQISRYQQRVDKVPLREQQLVDLTRDYATSRQQYDSLMQRSFSAELSADLERKQKGERFTILDPAQTPEKPFKPKRRKLAGAALVGSFLLSFGLAVGIDKLDTTIKGEGELEAMLPVSVGILGAIPTVEVPSIRSRQRRTAFFALTVSFLACLAVAAFIWRIRLG